MGPTRPGCPARPPAGGASPSIHPIRGLHHPSIPDELVHGFNPITNPPKSDATLSLIFPRRLGRASLLTEVAARHCSPNAPVIRSPIRWPKGVGPGLRRCMNHRTRNQSHEIGVTHQSFILNQSTNTSSRCQAPPNSHRPVPHDVSSRRLLLKHFEHLPELPPPPRCHPRRRPRPGSESLV